MLYQHHDYKFLKTSKLNRTVEKYYIYHLWMVTQCNKMVRSFFVACLNVEWVQHAAWLFSFPCISNDNNLNVVCMPQCIAKIQATTFYGYKLAHSSLF